MASGSGCNELAVVVCVNRTVEGAGWAPQRGDLSVVLGG